MNWKLIVLLSLFGLAIGVAGVFFVSPTVEPFCWLIAFIISAIAIAKKAPGKYFLHGFLANLLNSVWATAAHLVLYDRYIAFHPQLAEQFASAGIGPKQGIVMSGLMAGVLFGIILGLFAWIAGKLFKRT
jgi:hypothetical protein